MRVRPRARLARDGAPPRLAAAPRGGGCNSGGAYFFLGAPLPPLSAGFALP